LQLTGYDDVFRACEMGRKEMVKTLLEHNADGRIHPVTKYSPLYIACYNGRKDIVELLLKVRCSLSDICAWHFQVHYVILTYYMWECYAKRSVIGKVQYHV
jgi:ankyrin repeat protein